MYPLYFSAILKASNGMLLESGEACLPETGSFLDFNGESVPLMNLGEAAEIVRVLGEEELEHFPGQVYRCTKNVLRLTGIPPEALEKARALFDVNAHFPVSMWLSPDGSADFPEEKASRIGGNIRYVSSLRLKVTALEFIPEGQIMTLTTDSPDLLLQRLAVKVVRREALKRNAAVLFCDILTPSEANRRALIRFASSQGPQVRLL